MPVSEEEYRDHMRSHHAFMNRLAEEDQADDDQGDDDDDQGDDDDDAQGSGRRKATPPPRKRTGKPKGKVSSKPRPSSYGNPRWFGRG